MNTPDLGLKRIALLLATLGLLCGSAVPARAENDKVLIVPRFVPNQVDYVELHQDIEQTNKGGRYGEQGQTTSSRRLRGMLRRVLSASASEGERLTFTFDRLALHSDNPRRPVAFDSDAAADGDRSTPVASLFGAMLGESFTVSLDAQHRPRTCVGMTAVADKVLESVSDMFFFTQLQAEFTDEAAQLLWVDSSLAIYPNKAVGPGEKWNAVVKTHDLYLGDLTYAYECRLDRVETLDGRRSAIIVYGVDLRRPAGGKPGARQFGMLTEQVEGRVEGTATFDVERGLVVKQEEKLDLSVRAVTDAPEVGKTQEVTTQRKIRQTFAVLSEDARRAQKAANQTPVADPSKPAGNADSPTPK